MRMTAKLLLTAAAFAVAPAANAATFVPGDPNFTVIGDPFSGPVSAFYGNGGLSGMFTDMFEFTLGQNGFGSGSISTSNSGGATMVNFSSVVFNNGSMDFNVPIVNGLGSLSGIPISSGALNTLTVMGSGGGNGSYGGNLSFTPDPIPEPATWALLLLGFGAMGLMIRRRKQQAQVNYAF